MKAIALFALLAVLAAVLSHTHFPPNQLLIVAIGADIALQVLTGMTARRAPERLASASFVLAGAIMLGVTVGFDAFLWLVAVLYAARVYARCYFRFTRLAPA